MRPNDDRVSPCTAALPYRCPALLYGGVLPCYVPRCLLLHPRPWTQLTVCAHRHLASLRWFSAPPPRPGGSHTDPTMSKRCARERSGNSTVPFLDADGYLSWPCMASSPGAFPGSGVPRQVTALTSWTASDTLSVSANSYAPWPAWSTRLQYTAKDTPGYVPPCLACIVQVWSKRNTDARAYISRVKEPWQSKCQYS